MSRFALETVAFSVPKAGNRPDENEDAHAAAGGRFAVADGASEGWSSGPWARALADAFAAAPPTPDSYPTWLAATRASFSAPPSGGSWYAEAKQEQGAFATLVGLVVEPAKAAGLRWRAAAVGDSCLFQVRSGNLLARFPVEALDAFTNRPRLLGTAAASGVPEPDWYAGRAEPGDVFYLLTDALAEWFLREAANGGTPWAVLDGVTSGVSKATTAFAGWVESLRAARAVRNDDCTLMRVGINETKALP
jgi:serine/threonine protein phosphatase PrpC